MYIFEHIFFLVGVFRLKFFWHRAK